jgi:aminoglycoside phosphotransferase (APT) family kinase protein
MLRNEAVLVQHIRHHTKCPVPEVVAFDETLDNSIGVPYILMKELEGMTAACGKVSICRTLRTQLMMGI